MRTTIDEVMKEDEARTTEENVEYGEGDRRRYEVGRE